MRTLERPQKIFVYCPECNEPLTEDEADQVVDCGCPSCRTLFDIEDYVESENL